MGLGFVVHLSNLLSVHHAYAICIGVGGVWVLLPIDFSFNFYYFIGDELNGGSICVVHIGVGVGWGMYMSVEF